ncbi:MAG: type II toxin-antitoxin system Phd/YefM family antitoxin [Micrococcales bacterium]|nr:type II toxin-antitoxin system Phd/YefM family antitoxin [Micrococcales bacterium]
MAGLAASTWQLQDAKNRLSEVVRRSQEGPQTITLRGKPEAVVLSLEAYRALTEPRPSLVDVLRRAPEPLTDLIEKRSDDQTLRDVGL